MSSITIVDESSTVSLKANPETVVSFEMSSIESLTVVNNELFSMSSITVVNSICSQRKCPLL